MDSVIDDDRLPHASFKARVLAWRELDPAAHLYVLLDPSQPIAAHDPLHLRQPLLRDSQRHIERVPRPDLLHEPELLPRLLQIYAAGENGYPDEGLLDALLADATERARELGGSYVAGWIWTRAEPRALARHLASSGVMFDTGQGRERFIPLFEPHRLMLFAHADQGAAALDAWLGPIDHWLALDSRGTLRILTRSAAASAEAIHWVRSRLGLSESAAQQRVPRAKAVMAAMRQATLALPEAPEVAVDQALQRALARGLRAHEDIVFSALNDFSLGIGWAEHPTAAAAIARVLADSKRVLPGEFLALSPSEIEDIVRFGGAD